MRRLEGKSALITGAARGIGHEFAMAYIREGAKVCLADINIESALRAATDLGENAHAVFLDVLAFEACFYLFHWRSLAMTCNP